MKKNFLLFVIAFFASFTVLAQKPVTMKLDLPQGKVYKYNSKSTMTVQTSMRGQPMTIEIISSSLVNFKLLSKENDVLKVEIKMDSLETVTSFPGGKRTDNFAAPAKGGDYQGLMKNRFCTFPLIVKLSPTGKFLGFVNYQFFKDSVQVVLESVPDAKKDQLKRLSDALLKEPYLQSMIEPLFAYMPEKEVKSGDVWDLTLLQANEMLNLMAFTTYTLNGIEGNTAKVSGKTEMESMPSNDPNKKNAIEAKGSATSDFTVDLTTGLRPKISSTGHIEGTGGPEKTPVTVDSKSDVTLIQ